MAEEPSACVSASAVAPWRGSGTRTAARRRRRSRRRRTRPPRRSTRAAAPSAVQMIVMPSSIWKPSTAQYLRDATCRRRRRARITLKKTSAADGRLLALDVPAGDVDGRRWRRAMRAATMARDGDGRRPLAGGERLERRLGPHRRARGRGRSRGPGGRRSPGGPPADDSPPAGTLRTPSSGREFRGSGIAADVLRLRLRCPNPYPEQLLSSLAAASGSAASVIARTTTARRAPASTAAGSVCASSPPIANHGFCTVRAA